MLGRLVGPADIAVWTYQDSSGTGKTVALDEFSGRIGELRADGQHPPSMTVEPYVTPKSATSNDSAELPILLSMDRDG